MKIRTRGTSNHFFEEKKVGKNGRDGPPHTPYIGRKDEGENSCSKPHKRSPPLDLHRAVEHVGHNAVLSNKWSIADAEVSMMCAE